MNAKRLQIQATVEPPLFAADAETSLQAAAMEKACLGSDARY